MVQTLTPSMRRSVLIAMLRDEKLWPDGFKWDFARCHSCAIGLYCRAFEGRGVRVLEEWAHLERVLGLSQHEVENVFDSAYSTRISAVTPQMVADRLEQIHRTLP